MNEVAVAQTLKTWVLDNKDTLDDTLYVDMTQKEIQQVTSSVLTPPALYYYIAIDVDSAYAHYEDDGRPRARNVAHNTLKDTAALFDDYACSIFVADYAIKVMPVEGEEQSFEEEHELFRTLTDRIVNLLDQTDKFTDASGTYTMWIPGDGGDEDRRIDKDNRHDIWADENGQHFGIVCEIRFRIKACSTSVFS
jgi:hypothetical protein